ERADVAARAGAWLEDRGNARLLVRDAAAALDWLVGAVDSSNLRHGLKAGVRDALEHVPVNLALARMIEVALKGNHGQRLIDQLVEIGREQLDRHKFEIRLRIRAQSPWWMPKFVDEKIYDQLVSEFERVLHDIGTNADHPARAQFDEKL